MYNTWTYTKIVPHQRIEYILNFADKDGNQLDPASVGIPPGVHREVPHVISFRAVDANRTEVTGTEYGYTTDLSHDQSKAGMEQCLDKMAARLA